MFISLFFNQKQNRILKIFILHAFDISQNPYKMHIIANVLSVIHFNIIPDAAL